LHNRRARMPRMNRARNTRLLVFGFATVAGLGLAGTLLDSSSNANRGNSVSQAYESGLNWADPNASDLVSLTATSAGVQSEAPVATDLVEAVPEASEPQAIVSPASFDTVGSFLVLPDVLDGATAEQWRLAAVSTAPNDGVWVSLPGHSGPGSTLTASAGRSSGSAGAGGASFGGGGSGSSGRPGASEDANGQLSSGVANSTSGEGAHSSGKRADTSPAPFSAAASSSAPGLSLVTGSAFALTLPVQAAPFSSLLASNSAGSTTASASALEIAQVPEPGTLILLGTGLALLARRFAPRRRRDQPAGK